MGETDEKDRPKKEIKLIRTEVFKNPFKEAIAEAAKPKIEKVIDPVATWFSNRKDPMADHTNRHSSAVGKYIDDSLSRTTKVKRKPTLLPDEEMDYVNVANKSKQARTNFDFTTW